MNPIISHTTCQKCQKIFNVAELKENPESIGRICIDDIGCKKRQEEKKQASSNPALQSSR